MFRKWLAGLVCVAALYGLSLLGTTQGWELTLGTSILFLAVVVLFGIVFTWPLISRRVFKVPTSFAIWSFFFSVWFCLTVVVLASDLFFGADFWGRATLRIFSFSLVPVTALRCYYILVLLQVSPKYRERFNERHPMLNPEVESSPDRVPEKPRECE